MNKEDRLPIGGRLAEIRKRAEMTQSEFADEYGLSPSAYRNYERGTAAPPYELLFRLVKDYGVDSTWLLTGKGASEMSNYRDMLKRALMISEEMIAALGMQDQILNEKKADFVSGVYEIIVDNPATEDGRLKKMLLQMMQTMSPGEERVGG